MEQVTKVLLAADGRRKVEIFRREDGSYGFEALRYGEAPTELSWIPYGRFAECFVPDEPTAESEARGRVDWLRDQANGG